MSMPRPIRVAIAAYDGVSLLDLSGPLEALRLASTHPNHLGAKLAYDCHVVSVRGGTVLTADGLALGTQPVSTLDRTSIDTLIVPGACIVDDVFRDRELIKWLRRRAPRCRRGAPGCLAP